MDILKIKIKEIININNEISECKNRLSLLETHKKNLNTYIYNNYKHENLKNKRYICNNNRFKIMVDKKENDIKVKKIHYYRCTH